jgi:hypothetical protein
VGVLQCAYPDVDWDEKALTRRSKKSVQRWLRVLVEQIFPAQEVMEDFRHPQLRYLCTEKMGELDIFLPQLNLALEYHGKQHYVDMASSSFAPVEAYAARDLQKQQLCKQAGIVLVEVPFWWDKKLPSLRATIAQICQEILTDASPDTTIPKDAAGILQNTAQRVLEAVQKCSE